MAPPRCWCGRDRTVPDITTLTDVSTRRHLTVWTAPRLRYRYREILQAEPEDREIDELAELVR